MRNKLCSFERSLNGRLMFLFHVHLQIKVGRCWVSAQFAVEHDRGCGWDGSTWRHLRIRRRGFRHRRNFHHFGSWRGFFAVEIQFHHCANVKEIVAESLALNWNWKCLPEFSGTTANEDPDMDILAISESSFVHVLSGCKVNKIPVKLVRIESRLLGYLG